MSYTLGPTHAITGRGVQSVAQPIGLLVATASPPARVGSQVDQPTRFFGLGHVRAGDANGWHRLSRVDTLATVVYPLPDGVTRVGYSLADGVSATLTELVNVPSPTSLAPWDRNPAPIGQSSLYWNAAGTPANTLGWTYTVPAGRKLLLRTARVQHLRVAAAPAASLNVAIGQIALDTVTYLAQSYAGYQIAAAADAMTGDLVLGPGAILKALYSNAEASGGFYTTLQWAGVLIDA